jgi:hypothetical protein
VDDIGDIMRRRNEENEGGNCGKRSDDKKRRWKHAAISSVRF